MKNIERLIKTGWNMPPIASLIVEPSNSQYRAALVDFKSGEPLLCPAGERTLTVYGVNISESLAKLDKKIADGFAQYEKHKE